MPPNEKEHTTSRAGDAPVDKESVLETDGQSVLPSLEDRIKQGAATYQPTDASALLSWNKDELAVDISEYTRNEKSEVLVALLQEIVSQQKPFELEEAFERSKCSLVIAISDGALNRTNAGAVSSYQIVLGFILDKFRDNAFQAGVDIAHRRGKCPFNYSPGVDLVLVSCQPPSEDELRARMLKNFREQYKETQRAREEIDAKREEWLHERAEPLLDEIGLQMKNTSLPDQDKEELRKLIDQLRIDAYGYSHLVDTATAAELADLSERSIQKYVADGRLGLSLNSKAVFSQDEATAFGSKSRPKPGRPPKPNK